MFFFLCMRIDVLSDVRGSALIKILNLPGQEPGAEGDLHLEANKSLSQDWAQLLAKTGIDRNDEDSQWRCKKERTFQ